MLTYITIGSESRGLAMTLELETWRVPHSSWISRLGLGGGATQRARAPQTWLKPTSAGTVAPDNGEPDPVSGKVLVAEQRTPRWGRNPTCAEGSSLPFSRACLAEADQPGWTPGSQSRVCTVSAWTSPPGCFSPPTFRARRKKECFILYSIHSSLSAPACARAHSPHAQK